MEKNDKNNIMDKKKLDKAIHNNFSIFGKVIYDKYNQYLSDSITLSRFLQYVYKCWIIIHDANKNLIDEYERNVERHRLINTTDN